MSEDPPRELRPASAILLVGVHTIGTLAILAVGQALSGGGEDAPVSEVLVAGARLAAGLIALYVGLVRHAPNEATAAALRLERPAGRIGFVALGTIFGLLSAPLTYAVAVMLVSALGPEEAAAAAQLTTEGPGAEWIVAVAAMLLIPLADEALYRGLIQPRLTRVVGIQRGLVLSVLLYTASQLNPIALPTAVGFAILAFAAGNTWPAVAAVIANRVGLLWMPYLAGGAPPWWLTAGATALAAGVLVLTWRVRRPR